MKKNNIYRLDTRRWHVNRVVYLIGGILVFISSVLVLTLDVKWIYFNIFIGLMFINFSISGYCPMAIILDKLGFRR
jgi:hypothetical protein